MAIRLEDLLASFQRHLRAAAKAPRTIELYSQSVRYFSRWLADRGREQVLEELTRHVVAAWLAELAETAEPSTVGTRLRGMRRFCRWLVTEGVPSCGLAQRRAVAYHRRKRASVSARSAISCGSTLSFGAWIDADGSSTPISTISASG